VSLTSRDIVAMGAAGRLGLAGFFATAATFGPARNAYGLFLPEIRDEFGLSTQMLGLTASGLYVGYLAALIAVGVISARTGPRLPVLLGLLSAGAGTALVALSPNPAVLAAGVVLAGTGAGWSWAPYNDAVGEKVPTPLEDRVLSVISTGTAFGIAVTGLAALAATLYGLPWRGAWFAFAAGSLLVAALNAALLPRTSADGGESAGWPGLGWFWCAASAPLFGVALLFGVVNAVYWSFAADLVSGASGSAPIAGPLLYLALGVFGSAGLLTGDAAARFGLGRTLAATLVSLGVAAGLMGLAPGSPVAVAVSAALFGPGVMFMSALLSVWSSAVFRERPSTGFSAALFMFGIGSIAGPAAAGAMAEEYGMGRIFLFVAALAISTAFIQPKPEKRK